MAFSYASDRRIAGHLPQSIEAVGQQQGLTPHPGSRQGSLGSCMAPAHYNNIIYINGLHYRIRPSQLAMILEIVVDRHPFLRVSRETSSAVLRCSIGFSLRGST
jgi:hypothetical protein